MYNIETSFTRVNMKFNSSEYSRNLLHLHTQKYILFEVLQYHIVKNVHNITMQFESSRLKKHTTSVSDSSNKLTVQKQATIRPSDRAGECSPWCVAFARSVQYRGGTCRASEPLVVGVTVQYSGHLRGWYRAQYYPQMWAMECALARNAQLGEQQWQSMVIWAQI